MESNRAWSPDWGLLDVVVQKTISVRRTWRHPGGFKEELDLHLPWDTVYQLLRFRPQVVISTEMGVRSLGGLLYRLTCRGVRLILWLNLSEWTEQGRGRVRTWLRKRMLRMVDGVFVNGRSGARYLKSLGVKEQAIHFLPYSSDVGSFAGVPESRPEATSRRMLYVGQLVPRKGLLPFVRLLQRWVRDRPERRVDLTVVGDGLERGALESIRLDEPRVTIEFVGHVRYEDLPAYYASHGILVFPTLADEWGIVVNEAMASAMPVLGSVHSQAVEEMVEEGVTGWRFDPLMPDEVLSATTRAMSASSAQLASMRKACRERAAESAPEVLLQRVLQASFGEGRPGQTS